MYAIIPPTSLQHNPDILSAADIKFKDSPYPFGLGIYACMTDWSKRRTNSTTTRATKLFRPLPMLYVSDRAAADRSPALCAGNGGGVVAGWYVMALAGVQFEIRYGVINDRDTARADEDGFETKLYIDGAKSHEMTFQMCTRMKTVSKGFLLASRGTGQGQRMQAKISTYKFAKAKTREDGLSGMDVESGTIHLKVFSGRFISCKSEEIGNTWSYEAERVEEVIHEKVAAKQGRSLQVGCDAVITETSALELASDYVSCPRDWHEADVVVHVRERSWLRSRRIIDDDGNACSFATFENLLKESAPEARVVDKRSPKRRRLGKAAGDDGRSRSEIVVVDLT